MNKDIALTKTCMSCGLQKPLIAFLELTGASGQSYGNICADCRKANMDKVETPKEPDETTISSTGLKIDAKARVKEEADKREKREHVKELDLETREKTEAERVDKEKKKQIFTQDQQKHRDLLKNASVFATPKKDNATQNKERALDATHIKQQNIEHTHVQEKVAKDEEKLKTIDFTAPYIPSQTGHQVKLEGKSFLEFKKWVGGGAAINRNAEQAAKLGETRGDKPADKKLLTEFAEKHWSPKSR